MEKPDFKALNSQLKSIFDNPAIEDTEQHLKSLMQSQLRKMGMVSREEFDAQTAVLQRTRQRLQALEKEFEALQKS